MLTKTNPLKQRSPQELSALCQAGDASACQLLKVGKVGFDAGGVDQNRANLTYGMSDPNTPLAQTQPFAEGGQALLAPYPMDFDEMSDSDIEGEGDNYDIQSLLAVLEDGEAEELIQAIEAFPVVATVARMAIKTSDGAVEGEGGPKDDLIPAKLSDGEFVFSAEAVDAIGLENLELMHNQAKQSAATL
jgi:hypothetical protein